MCRQARRSTKSSPNISARRLCCRRCSWRSRIRAPIRATAAKGIAASIRTRFRGRHRRVRCPWRLILKSYSSACSVTAGIKRSDPRVARSNAVSSTRSPTAWDGCKGPSAMATACGSSSTSTTYGRSSAGWRFQRRRRQKRPICRCPMVCPSPSMSTSSYSSTCCRWRFKPTSRARRRFYTRAI